jgi:hypothetical protein
LGGEGAREGLDAGVDAPSESEEGDGETVNWETKKGIVSSSIKQGVKKVAKVPRMELRTMQ